MANEIIKLIEYITGSPVVQGAFIAYIVFFAIVALIAIGIIVFTFCTIFNIRKRMK